MSRDPNRYENKAHREKARRAAPLLGEPACTEMRAALASIERLERERDEARDEAEALRAWNAILHPALEAIRDYPEEGHPRRTDDGYPVEVAFDEFAYKRIVDTYRDVARTALAALLDQPEEPT